MNILLFNQFFWPDTAPTGQLLTDVAHYLADSPHKVTAICGSGAYIKSVEQTPPPIDIVRVPTLNFGRASRRQRLASYISFLAGSAWYGLHAPRNSVLVTLTTPPLLSMVGALIRRIRGGTHYIWEMDVYPDLAVDLGVLRRRSSITRIIQAMADYSRRNADGIIAIGECMRNRLIAQGIPASKIHVAENWADAAEITSRPLPQTQQLRLLHSGNFGMAHDVDTLSSAMLSLAGDSRFEFIFAGGGSQYHALGQLCRDRGVTNAIFRSYCSRAELAQSLSQGHVGIVTQKPETLGALVPSKTYGIMAAGRPVLFIGPKQATPARIIEKYRCGWQVDPGDNKTLLSLLHYLSGHRQAIRVAGMRARTALLENYDRPIGVSRIGQILGVAEKRSLARAVGA